VVSYSKTNFSTIMSFLELARAYNKNEEYFMDKTGDIHKVYAEYVPNNNKNIFEITVNDVEMGGEYADLGDAYDFLKELLTVP